MLYGMVFMSHQVGGFLGAWMAGWLFDITGSYAVMWGLSIGLAILAAMVHHPIDDRSLEAGTPARVRQKDNTQAGNREVERKDALAGGSEWPISKNGNQRTFHQTSN